MSNLRIWIFISNLQSKANSGVQVNLSTECIKDSDILVPPLDLQLEYGNVIYDLYSKKELNDLNIKTITSLRDTLLPKLMSGEVRVKTEP
jgi:type I restriction enzyme S subunit